MNWLTQLQFSWGGISISISTSCTEQPVPLPPFFRTGEVLDGANKYRCSKEAKPVRAVKRISIHSAPNVLVLQLKRFEFSLSGHKISKKVRRGGEGALQG